MSNQKTGPVWNGHPPRRGSSTKLGLLLLPLVPLSAIGIVEIIDTLIAPTPIAVTEVDCIQPAADPTRRPAITTPPVPQPTPQPVPPDQT